MTKRIVFIGDLHVGSIHGLSTPEIVTDGEEPNLRRIIPCNAIQQQLYDNWDTVIENIGRVDTVVVNGDLCEGMNRKGEGEGCWTNSRDLQAETCADLLSMWKTPEIVVINGTGYHTGTNVSLDQLVAIKLSNAVYAGPDKSFNIDGYRIHASHKIGICGADKKGRFTAIGREIQAAMLNNEYYGKYDMIVRSHVHYHVYAGMENMLGMTLPAWKARDDFAKSNSLNWVPHHGAVVVEIDCGEMSWFRHMFELSGDCKPEDHYI